MFWAGAPPVAPMVKATESCPSPGVIQVTVGASGVTAMIAKVAGVDDAGSRLPLAATDAVIEQLPTDTNVTAPVPAFTVQVPGVADA